MSSLWVFGDSYSMTWENCHSWVYQVSIKLNLDLKNYSVGGSSLGYTYEKFNTSRNEILDKDIVIIVATDLDRQNFFPFEPELASPSNLKISNNIKIDAYSKYFSYLNNQSNNEINLINFLYNVSHLQNQKDIKILIISGFSNTCLVIDKVKHQFSNLLFSTGYLTDISINELDDIKFIEVLKNVDPRYNHLCLSNHKILAEKVVDSILTGCVLNLSTMFHKHIINKHLNPTECNPRIWINIVNSLYN